MITTTAVGYRSVIWNCQLIFTLISVFCLLTEEGCILEPSKILNKEFYRWTTKNLLLYISRSRVIWIQIWHLAKRIDNPQLAATRFLRWMLSSGFQSLSWCLLIIGKILTRFLIDRLQSVCWRSIRFFMLDTSWGKSGIFVSAHWFNIYATLRLKYLLSKIYTLILIKFGKV